MKLNYSIKDIETLSGIKAHTLRIWERRYNVVNPKRTATNIRYYSDEQLKLIMWISLLNKNNYKISRIAKMDIDEIKEEIKKVQKINNSIDKSIFDLTEAMIELNEIKFYLAANNYISINGMENAILHLLLPFLNRVGKLWFNGTITVGYEHFISNLVRKLLIREINLLDYKNPNDIKKFILYTKEKEFHDLTLFMSEYLLRKKGFYTTFIGADTPFDSLKSICSLLNPDYLLVVFTIKPSNKKGIEYVSQMINDFKSLKLLLCGNPPDLGSLNNKDNIICIRDFDSFIKLIDNL